MFKNTQLPMDFVHKYSALCLYDLTSYNLKDADFTCCWKKDLGLFDNIDERYQYTTAGM